MHNGAGVAVGLVLRDQNRGYARGICGSPVPTHVGDPFAGRHQHECATCMMVLCPFHTEDCQLRRWSPDLQRWTAGCDDEFCPNDSYRHRCGGVDPWIVDTRYFPPDLVPTTPRTPPDPDDPEEYLLPTPPNAFQIPAVPRQLPLIVVISVFLVYFVRTAGATEDLSDQFLYHRLGEDYMHHTSHRRNILESQYSGGCEPQGDGHVEVRHASEFFRAKPLSSMNSDRFRGLDALIGGKKMHPSWHHPITPSPDTAYTHRL